MNAPDLTQRPPRSPRVRLGGYVILPRTLDKCRATIAGKNGEYHFNCPLDERVLTFTGIDADALKEQAASGKGDWELLQWINENSTAKPTDAEIEAWSDFQLRRAPASIEMREFVNEEQKKVAPEREDIATFFDLLDLDDHASFGGQV
jgi:hypothetical protein